MKRVMFILLFLGFSCLDLYAQSWDFYTAEENSFTKKDSFLNSEQPYTYFSVDKDFFDYEVSHLDIHWTWSYLNCNEMQEEFDERYRHLNWERYENSSGDLDLWESPVLWPDIVKSGQWQAHVSWKAFREDTQAWTGSRYKTVDFTVTPEPLGCILFFLGAGVLGLRKNKKW